MESDFFRGRWAEREPSVNIYQVEDNRDSELGEYNHYNAPRIGLIFLTCITPGA
ncbi:MAG: hypothetical protein JOZ78_22585 [Chroococcidiopsidaceae cyanobacterium CP_BM_ER_R8_30]|nr:hypothetical protein [Chroococcidiopsidaceae cyanobacterium CP_BM_ER_R8_30]